MARQSEKPTQIKFQFNGQIVVASQGDSVLEALLRAEIPIDHSCGGNASCGTCRSFLKAPSTSAPPRNELEQEMAEARGFSSWERLCCQLSAEDGLELYSPDFDEIKKGLE